MDESHLARRVHRPHHILVRRLGVSRNDHGERGVPGGNLVDRRLQGPHPVVHESLAVYPVLARLVDENLDLPVTRGLGLALGLGQVDAQLGLPGERGGDHEEDQ